MIASPGTVHVTLDGSVLAVYLPGGAGDPRNFARGQRTYIAAPDPDDEVDPFTLSPAGPRTALDHDLAQALADLGYVIGARPRFVPPGTAIVRR